MINMMLFSPFLLFFIRITCSFWHSMDENMEFLDEFFLFKSPPRYTTNLPRCTPAVNKGNVESRIYGTMDLSPAAALSRWSKICCKPVIFRGATISRDISTPPGFWQSPRLSVPRRAGPGNRWSIRLLKNTIFTPSLKWPEFAQPNFRFRKILCCRSMASKFRR